MRTPEQKEHLSKLMKERWAAKRQATKASEGTQVVDPNPIAGPDLVPASVPTPVGRPRYIRHASESRPVNGKSFVHEIISTLNTLNTEAMTYQETGEMINALSAATTTVALARRQKQEQLQAGTHRAPCATCGRLIDISKSGGYQILTERDEHFMPINRFYCSQNCLLAKNMPSHARQTSREKRENQA